MILSGAQSALAGGLFIKRLLETGMPGVTDVAPYAAAGAFYLLVSAPSPDLWQGCRRSAMDHERLAMSAALPRDAVH